jgi:signal transduction histidine kinase
MGVETGVFALFAVSGVFLWRSRNSVLDMWLLVALAAMVIQSLMVLTLHARFTVGWYGLYLQTLASRLVVMLALLAESNRLYARLALASSARNRERDVRLMSMDAVASAIAQEVGQTVAAVMLNLRSSRAWLSGATPQVDEAIASLDAAIDAGNATFGAIKGAQALFATGRGLTTDCSVNDLVRASASSLSRELAGRKISLHLDLDKRVSTIVANPVQLQRVFVNLLTNAMEALDTVRGRSRRIGVRTALFEGNQVLIEISDNGGGIEQDEVARIFDDFFTTKASGTGLGLSLSRTIVEEHGGRLWASAGEEHGAVFHVQLPLSALP